MGTKSVLWGAHAFWLHPFFVALAWWRLYGFRPVKDPYVGRVSLFNPVLWLVFFIHDLGYWGSEKMDDEYGEEHPVRSARLLLKLLHRVGVPRTRAGAWFNFTMYHSRFLAKQYGGTSYSLLCPADKLAVALEPRWIYLLRVRLTGEHREYMALAYKGKYETMNINSLDVHAWHKQMTDYVRRWAWEHRLPKRDSWTPEAPEVGFS